MTRFNEILAKGVKEFFFFFNDKSRIDDLGQMFFYDQSNTK